MSQPVSSQRDLGVGVAAPRPPPATRWGLPPLPCLCAPDSNGEQGLSPATELSKEGSPGVLSSLHGWSTPAAAAILPLP